MSSNYSRIIPLFILSGIVFSAGLLSGQALFVKPVKVLGDPHYIGTAANPTAADSPGPNVVEGRELQSPEGIALDNSASPPIVYIADSGNNRILAYRYGTQLTPGAPADLILGQPDRFTTTPGGSGGGPSTGLRLPTGLAVDKSGNLYVSDTGNNRILRYPTPFAQPPGYQFPDIVIGQTSFSATTANAGGAAKASTLALFSGSFAGRAGLAFDVAGNLWVADILNNRVLRFPVSVLKAQQFGPSADLAVGQPDLLTTTAATARQSKIGLAAPTGLAFDLEGHLFVTDHLARALVYPFSPGLNASALRIMGVDTNESTFAPDIIAFNTAQSIGVVAGNILVADNSSSRVMVFPPYDSWDPELTRFSPPATAVIGQADYTSLSANRGTTFAGASTLSSPFDLAASATELFVADAGNHRILVYPISSGTIAQTATRVIGQLDFPYNAPNLVEGKEFNTIASSGLSGSAIVDYSSTPPHLYVADTANNRVLGFNDFSQIQNGQAADLVLGQPDLFHTGVNYPSGVATQPGPQGFNQPTSIAVDSAGNVYVADTFNARILRFPAPFASGFTGKQFADLVIGQSDFSARVTDTTPTTLAAPVSIAFSKDGANTAVANSGWLVVADASQNRVLLFPKPFSKGMAAGIVLGQASFTAAVAAATPAALNQPFGVAVDPQDRIVVSDSGNDRLQIYPAAGSLTATSASPSFAVTSGLNTPTGIGMAASGQFWVADQGAGINRVFHFNSIDQLPIASPPYSSDTSVPVFAPRAAFNDQYNNLLVADGANRILYYAPSVDAQNAANYLSTGIRALAPGTFAAIYPTLKSNVISSGTQVNTTLPWSTVTSDTEVTLNGTPAAIYFTSPGQINFPVPMNMPSGGTVDLQVIRPSTGQIYGAAEIPMATASPALFVLGGQQSGPAAALNQDNSVNTATNPAARGSVLQLFGTGEGYVVGAPPEGQASCSALTTGTTPQVLIGPSGSNSFVPASNIQYTGIAPCEIGVWQINFQVPANAPTGTVPITIFMNSIPSTNPSIPAQIVTTVAIK